jgi:hypothetical protein
MVLTLPRYPDACRGPRMVPSTIDGEDARGGDLSSSDHFRECRSLKSTGGVASENAQQRRPKRPESASENAREGPRAKPTAAG